MFCLSNKDINKLSNITNEDIVINFCGVNRATTEGEYIAGNETFVINLVESFGKSRPFLVHLSSLMVYGFEDINNKDLSAYQRFFIDSKLNGEKHLINNYPNDKLCIIRPSNIFGFDCEPYYNNLLVTLIHEKITGNQKITKINKNCKRNFLSVSGLSQQIMNIIIQKRFGTYNIISNNDIKYDELVNILYDNNKPDYISIVDDASSVMNQKYLDDKNILIHEDFPTKIFETESKMINLLKINESIEIKKLGKLSQSRGDMVEISDLNNRRLYLITIKPNAVRGNHYHFIQHEHFYINRGKILYLFAHKENPEAILIKILDEGTLIKVNPLIIHSLANNFIGEDSEIIIVSTQEFIPNQSPDTVYVPLL
ncbi:MAG: NAD-dependent epimerase/dehydratase family protein [Hyperionvirus sp.]|uniref:NAD-dependent epimerase/dehydratase family protein n=1 Tax=Hyperionvirus sp. TaxID=2487770 RepID=A0A3G5A8D8_9VIRU|nr:MAG: NAD-dependent epimerase/dehydratase family protein [Hyperionvirus sp.]